MFYSKIQKFISSYLIFTMLFLLAFRIPFYEYKSYADTEEFHDLVSIIVNENVYSSLRGEITRYAKDIQGVLENTQVVILPTPSDATSLEIASLNESLFFEGYKSIKDNPGFDSKLVGTVIIGDFDLPTVYIKEDSSKTILPFTDFIDKSYIYNHKNNRYEENLSNINGIKAEIWHGVISPSTNKISSLRDYFDKNNDFYEGKGNFKTSSGILNGVEFENGVNKLDDIPLNYEPFVFYYDQFREEKAINHTKYNGYRGYVNNRDDLVYNRFSKDLAYSMSDEVVGAANDEILDLLTTTGSGAGLLIESNRNLAKLVAEGVVVVDHTASLTLDKAREFSEVFADEYSKLYENNPIGIRELVNREIPSYVNFFAGRTQEEFFVEYSQEYADIFKELYEGEYKLKNDINLDGVPDIQTRHITKKMSKLFLEIFAGGIFSDFRNDVYNAGRYNGTGSEINVDLIPYLISVLDTVNDEVIKDANTEIENEIDRIVEEDGISRNVAIPTKYIHKSSHNYIRTYNNYFYGVKGEDIETASQCSIYRGSISTVFGPTRNGYEEGYNIGTLVEANRGTNIGLISDDIEFLNNEPEPRICFDTDNIGIGTYGWWGGNSPINLNFNTAVNGTIELNGNVLQSSLLPLYDINGSISVGDTTKIPSPLNCRTNIPLEVENEVWDDDHYKTVYRTPTHISADGGVGIKRWYCITNNLILPEESFVDKYRNYSRKNLGLENSVLLNGCQQKNIYLDGILVSSIGNAGGDCDDNFRYRSDYLDYYYKTIPSYLVHKSPTADELYSEINANVTQALPVDLTRYIDFISAKGNLTRIDYPNLFDISHDEGVSSANTLIRNKLYTADLTINGIIRSESPQLRYQEPSPVLDDEDKINNIEKNIYNHLRISPRNGKINDYLSYDEDLYDTLVSRPPSSPYSPYTYKYSKEKIFTYGGSNYPFYDFIDNSFGFAGHDSEHYYKVNLYQNLKEKKNINYYSDNGEKKYYYKEIEIDGDKKYIDYLDVVAFAIHWKNLSTSQKYEYVISHYLVDQFGDENQQYFLPKNKKEYEIAYLGASGTATDMYIKIDPEGKFDNPYSDVVKENLKLSASLMSSNIGDGISDGTGGGGGTPTFSCSPAEGAMLPAWLPAVSCWLGNLMPPSIDISGNKCGPSYESSQDSGNINISGNLEIEDIINIDDNTVMSAVDDIINNAEISLDVDIDGLNTRGIYEAYIDNEVNFEVFVSDSLEDTGLDEDNIKILTKTIINEIDDIENTISNNFSKSYKLEIVESENGDEKLYTSVGVLSVGVSSDTNIYLMESSLLDDGIIDDEFTFNVLDDDFPLNGISNVVEGINDDSDSREKLVLSIENTSYPLIVKLFTGTVLSGAIDTIHINSIESYIGLFDIQKSGSYRIEIEDSNGNISAKNIQLVPEVVESIEIELGSSVIQSNSGTTTNFITLYDRFNNVANGENYELTGNLDSSTNSVIFKNSNTDLWNTDTVEGYKVFDLKGIKKGISRINFSIFKDGEELASTSTSVKVIDDFVFGIYGANSLKVGGDDLDSFNFYIKDENGNTLSDFNSRVYVSNNSFIVPTHPYFELVDGIAQVDFYTKELAGENIEFEFQVEGINHIERITRTIQPDVPMKLDISIDKSKITTSESSNVTVELKDRYNNLVFNDDSRTYELYLNGEEDISNSNSRAGGVTNFEISSNIPSTVNFKVRVLPSLEVNSYFLLDDEGNILLDDDGNNLKINGVSENAGKIEVFYNWGSDVRDKKYNAIYTTLLGSNYGDIDETGYLAGELLFNGDNRALAVTALLNNPYENVGQSAVLKIGYGIDKGPSSNHLEQDIKIRPKVGTEGSLYYEIFNSALGVNIGNLYNNFENSELNICDDSISECLAYDNEIDDNIYLKSISPSYNILLEDDNLSLLNDEGVNVFSINKLGVVSNLSYIDFEFDEQDDSNYIGVNIKRGSILIAKLLYKSIDQGFSVVDFDSNAFNSTYFIPDSNKYYSKVVDNTIIIAYNDPFSSEKQVNDFSKNNYDGIEYYEKKSGIGWNDGNKSLLAFAAGKTVGESVQDYVSFGVINLGDPVISLKKIKKKKKVPGTGEEQKRALDGSLLFDDITDEPIMHPVLFDNKKFDSTIGKLISNDNDIEGYKIFDYNNDDNKDILLIKSDNNLKLLQKPERGDKYIDKGNLISIYDLGNKDLIHSGNFKGDGYDDIFFINDIGKAFLLDNVNGIFERIQLELFTDSVLRRIIGAEMFDMNYDGKDDIVTLDDLGEINIFYGPDFRKKLVSDDYGLEISDESRNDNSLIYFNGLKQPSNNPLTKTRIDNILFVGYPYSTGGLDLNSISVDDIKPSLGKLDFIKSEYSEEAGIKVEKTYENINGSTFIKTGDKVKVNIKITNNTGSLNEFAFAEKVEKTLKIYKETIIYDDNKLLIEKGKRGYDFLFTKSGSIDFENGEILDITYEAEVKPIKYGYLEVGLLGDRDDNYGDIIIKESHENCGADVVMFEGYNNGANPLGFVSPSCDDNKIKLPDLLEKNSIDEYYIAYSGARLLQTPPLPSHYKVWEPNGTPDYLDELFSTGYLDDVDNDGTMDYVQNQDDESIHSYAEYPPENEFSSLYFDKSSEDSDEDGIPDNEDIIDVKENSIILDIGNIGLFGGLDAIDEGLDQLQEVMNALNCRNSSCFALPINWAPLAPGNDLVFMGKLIGDGLTTYEGLPVFSMFTWMWAGPLCVPTVWPMSPLSVGCSPARDSGGNVNTGAGGWLGDTNPTNFFRVYVTPTLTGGIGYALCFGGPASVVGNIPPQGVSPLLPGGNCIVFVQRMTCGDENDGDPSSVGIPKKSKNYTSGNYGLINANCSVDQETTLVPDPTKLGEYLDGTNDFNFSPDFFSSSNKNSLFTQGGADASVTLDFDAAIDGNFEDIIKIQQKRISPFPSWLMDWVTRQVEEIANKLTDLPTIFIILPEFAGVFDANWGDSSGSNSKSGGSKVSSGIKEAYNFLSSSPLINIEQETVNITIPWISVSEIDKTVEGWLSTIDQREDELEKAEEDWSDISVSGSVSAQAMADFGINLKSLISTLDANIDIIKSYKEIPDKITALINSKEKYLEQILCNVDSISAMLGGRIGENGERFKAWVKTYLLIKAILKSWQLLIDLFIDFDLECHDCKNERQDGLEDQFSMIGFIVPSIPIIKFPKWPDIVIDLHNIRVGLTIGLPEFNIGTKPIVLPSLPKLYLPEAPDINLSADLSAEFSALLNLPEIPLLPEIFIPSLPDLPSIPSIELPNLPPPIKLPEMPGGITFVISIIKLILKAVCIIKSIPIHPEWRAGDQIAYLTERNGYLGMDFFEATLPDFTFPMIDSINLTSSVNLEFESDFIVEMAKIIAMPINTMSNEFINLFNFKSSNFDFRGIVPSNVDVDADVNLEGDFEANSGNYLNKIVSKSISNGILNIVKLIKNGSKDTLTSNEFRALINESLLAENIINDPEFDGLREVWDHFDSITYSKENALINELQKNNSDKFNTLKDIINTEIINNKEIKNKLKNIGNTPIITEVGYINTNIDLYNDKLSVYNEKFIKSAKELINPTDNFTEEIKKSGNLLIEKVKTALNGNKSYNDYEHNGSDIINYNKGIIEKSAEVPNFLSNIGAGGQTSCQIQSKSDTKYNYKGLYILDNANNNFGDDVEYSYNLFDNLNELTGEEETTFIDFDNDGDEDILYFMNNQLFYKENLEKESTTLLFIDNVITHHIGNNKFFNGFNEYYESVNNFDELWSEVGNINLGFLSHTDSNINNYRVLFSDYSDDKKSIIDGISGIEDATKLSIDEIEDKPEPYQALEGNIYITRKNLAYIKNIGVDVGTKLITKELINIQENLILSGSVVNILKNTVLYAGNRSVNIIYKLQNSDEELTMLISPYENIEFLEGVKIISTRENQYTRPFYVEGYDDIILEGINTMLHRNKPLFPGTKITSLDGGTFDITYYDGTELELDFDDNKSWEIYDLGLRTVDNFIGISDINNTYYKATINVFKDNIIGNLSNEILLSPQIVADDDIPEIFIENIELLNINLLDENNELIDSNISKIRFPLIGDDYNFIDEDEINGNIESFTIDINYENGDIESNFPISSYDFDNDNMILNFSLTDDYFINDSLGIESLIFNLNYENGTGTFDISSESFILGFGSINYDITDDIYENGGIINIESLTVDIDLSDGTGSSDIVVDLNDENIILHFPEFDAAHKRTIGVSITDKNNNEGYYEIGLEIGCNGWACEDTSVLLCPEYTREPYTRYVVGEPFNIISDWQSIEPLQACYYECINGYELDSDGICSIEPNLSCINPFNEDGEPYFEHADFTQIGEPYEYQMPWQNQYTNVPCYYECTDGYSGYDCSIAPSCEARPSYVHSRFYNNGLEGLNPPLDEGLTEWQNITSDNACYYECTNGYSGDECIAN